MKLWRWCSCSILLACVFAVSASAQKGGARLPGAEEIAPTTADPGLKTEYDGVNVALLPKGKSKPELVVMLPGTGGRPANYSALYEALSQGGFHVIGLMYDNKPNENTVCGDTGDLECHRKFREERFAGDAPGTSIQNTPAEGIDHRLVMMLKYLDKEHPKDGWGQYLDGDEPAWKKIIISGHSQGSGHAAYIAKYHEVARVVLFSGPYDGIDLRTSPKISTWLSDPSKTPLDRWYAEHHEKDLGAPIIPLTNAALKIPPDHIIVSSLEPTADSKGAVIYHMMGTHDERMLPQWKWLFGIEGGVK